MTEFSGQRKLGSHVSMTGGLLGAAKEAVSYGASTFMVYTGAPQNTIRRDVSKLKIPEGQEYMEAHGLSDIVVHAPYIINMASCKEETYALAKRFLITELERTKALGSRYLVIHPGSYTEKTPEYGMERISEAVNEALGAVDSVTLCLETMAGKGSELGRTFEELARIIELTEKKERIGVCFDTCHAHDAGYDIINDLDGVLGEFDKTLGLDKMYVVHLNGSLNIRGAKKDRHANLGAGADNPRGEDKLGFDAVAGVFLHKKLKDKVFILETPWLDEKTNLYKEEIAALRREESNGQAV